MRAIVVDDAGGLESWESPWDDLAGTMSRPFCSPSWMLPWWHAEAPPGACLRAIVVVDQHGLLAIAPFFTHPDHGALTRYRLLASARGTPIEPLARPGQDHDAASAIVGQLGDLTPRPDLVTIEGATRDWAERISRAWPGGLGSSFHRDRTASAPVLDLTGRSFEEWFSSKSGSFQKKMRRSERKLRSAGYSPRVADSPDQVGRGLAALSVHHLRRWDKRGGSRVWRPGTAAMLHEAEERLRSTGRFRLVTIDNGTDFISAHLFVAAGHHLSYWLGGFDEAWAEYSPGMVALVAALRDAWQQGYRRVDLGQGLHSYKLRLAEGRQELEWLTLIPPGFSGVRTRLQLAPRRGARALKRRLPDSVRDWARERLRRPG